MLVGVTCQILRPNKNTRRRAGKRNEMQDDSLYFIQSLLLFSACFASVFFSSLFGFVLSFDFLYIIQDEVISGNLSWLAASTQSNLSTVCVINDSHRHRRCLLSTAHNIGCFWLCIFLWLSLFTQLRCTGTCVNTCTELASLVIPFLLARKCWFVYVCRISFM